MAFTSKQASKRYAMLMISSTNLLDIACNLQAANPNIRIIIDLAS